MSDLSVLIAARQERYLPNTVADTLAHAKGDTEIIVVLDGAWPEQPLPQHERVTVVFVPESIGQRAAINLAARISRSRYVMKLDAHCAVAPGFDVELLRTAEELGPRTVQIPAQKNLHVYDQVCQCGWRGDQAPHHAACPTCGGTLTHEVVWKPRRGSTTSSWVLDSDLHFQYDKGGQARQLSDICDVMTSLGACIFLSREYFWQLGGLDEATGSWGQFGAEIACKAWLSGGRHVVNRRTWFAHFFRVGGIGFPYPIKGSDQERAREYSRRVWRGNEWPGQVRPLSWLVEKFWPVPGWTEAQREQLEAATHQCGEVAAVAAPVDRGAGVRSEGPGRAVGAVDGMGAAVRTGRRGPSSTVGVVYYSDGRAPLQVLEAARRTIEASGFPIVAVTLQPLWSAWPAARNLVLPFDRGVLTMFRQILAGIEALDTDLVFLAEHDVLYHRSHWTFRPDDRERVWYNQHVYKVDAASGRALHYRCSQTSGLCADRRLLLEHYRRRVAIVEATGYTRNMGFEPGTHGRQQRVDDLKHRVWMSEFPNVDIRHHLNLTPSRWSKEEFRNQRYTAGWTEAEAVPGWGRTAGRMDEFLRGVIHPDRGEHDGRQEVVAAVARD